MLTPARCATSPALTPQPSPRTPVPVSTPGPPRAGRLARGRLVAGRGADRAAAAPVLAVRPGQELLVDQIPAQRGVVAVDRPQEQADPALVIANAGLERLRDHV